MASVMVEHGLTDLVGVTFDGTGYGLDGATWGGESSPETVNFTRAAHCVWACRATISCSRPWRMAMAYATDAGGWLARTAD